MSVSQPQNRDEMRQYILTKLGAPVLEVNVSHEQIDIAIDDAFQYFNERSHVYGTESMYLGTRMTPEFVTAFTSHNIEYTDQRGKNAPLNPIPGRPSERAAGMVSELTLVSPGTNYPPNRIPMIYAGTDTFDQADITTEANLDISTEDNKDLVFQTTGSGAGTGLTVSVGSARTINNGLVSVTPYNVGHGYEVGDLITISGNNAHAGTIEAFSHDQAAVFQVTKVKTESPVLGTAAFEIQNNYLVLPDNVIGVTQVMRSQQYDLIGIFPGGSVFPVMLGGVLGNDFACGNMGYDLVSYVAMREYLATLDFLFFPPIPFNFNLRTHRVYIDANRYLGAGTGATTGAGQYLVLECMVKPSPEVYPDLFNDMWLKDYAVALVKAQWGRNLTKYNQVQMPGGITLNGDRILTDAQQEIAQMKERFAMDWAAPPLDMVG